jgi:hypothetical protein
MIYFLRSLVKKNPFLTKDGAAAVLSLTSEKLSNFCPVGKPVVLASQAMKT